MIADILPRYQEVANGTKKAFTVPFDILDSSYINVYLGSTKQTSGFSINVSGKKVTFTTAPSSSTVVTIVRVIPTSWEQEVLGAVNAETLNNIFTVLIAKMQTLEEGLNRAIKTDVTDTETGSTHFLELLSDAIDSLGQANTKLAQVQSSATQALSDISDAETTALSNFNSNATSKTNTFNTNASNKTTAFDNNYTTKKAAVDAKADEAAASAALAKKWAIGDPSEPTGHSAEYWAEQASLIVGDAAHLSLTETFTGDKTFEKEIKGYLASYSANNAGSTSDTYLNPYKKLCDCVVTGTNTSRVIPFLYSKTQNADHNSGSYLGRISIKTYSTAGEINVVASGVVLTDTPDYINNGDIIFYLLYKNNTPSSGYVTVEVWVYVKSTYTGISVIPLKIGTGGTSYSTSSVTWYNNTIKAAELPSGYEVINQNIVSNYIATPAASDDSKKAANTEFVHDAIALDAVTLTGDQDIAGVKKLTSGILGILRTNATKGTNPSSSQYWNIYLNDKNGTGDSNALGRIMTVVEASGLVSTNMYAYKNATGTSNARISVYYPTSGSAYTYAPAPTEDTTSSTQIDTVGARNTKLANYAGLGTANTFTNTNTISGANKTLTIKNTNITRGTAPSAAVNQTYILGKDSANKSTWAIYHTWETDLSALTRLICYRGTTTDTTWSGIGVGYNSSGVAYTVAPTPNEDTTSSTQIDTVGARNTKLASYATTSAMNSVISTSPYLVLYGTSTSAADATAKIVEISSSYATTPTISAGQLLIVKPTITSTVADSTITVQKSSTTLLAAKTMKYNNANITTSTDSIVWSANVCSIFVYDGSYWQFLGHGLDNNTTYSAMSVSEGTTGTATSSRVMRADYLKQIIEGLAISQTNTYYDSSSSTLYIG